MGNRRLHALRENLNPLRGTSMGSWNFTDSSRCYIFVFAAEEGMTWWLVVGALSSGLSAAASAIVTAHELGHKKRGVLDGDSLEFYFFLSTTLTLPTSIIMFIISG